MSYSNSNNHSLPMANGSIINRISTTDVISDDVSCWSNDTTSLLFQLAYICLLIAYLSPGGKYCLLFIHVVSAVAHLLITIWVSNICFTIPSLLGWSITFLCVNVLRIATQLYITRHIKFAKELEEIYEELFGNFGVSRESFKKLVAQGKLITLHSGEAYAVEKVTATNRLSLLISGKINVNSKNHFLHSIKPGEFLDSPEWESGIGYTTTTPNQYSKASSAKSRNDKHNIYLDGGSGKPTSFDQSEMRPIISDQSINGGVLPPPDNRFNVSLIAATQCRILYWNRIPLEYHLAKDKHVFKVLRLILGRDITNKLYAMNEKIVSDKGSLLDIRLPIIINSLSQHMERKPSQSIVTTGMDRPIDPSVSTVISMIQPLSYQRKYFEQKNSVATSNLSSSVSSSITINNNNNNNNNHQRSITTHEDSSNINQSS